MNIEKILTTYRGSHAHGLAQPDSDVDIISCAFPSVKQLIGLEQFGSSGTIETKDGNMEHVIYDIRKLFTMWRNMNPNAIEMLWVKPEHILTCDDFGEHILSNRTLFSSKYGYSSFKGYALGQLEKMDSIKSDFLEDYMDLCTELKYRGIHPQHKGEIFNQKSLKFTSYSNEDLLNDYKVFLKSNSNLGRLGEKRKQLILKHGYDTKNASHLIRILTMAIEFFETGVINVYRTKDRDDLLDVKNGKFSANQIKDWAKTLCERLDVVKDKSDLPDKPDDEKIDQFLVSLISDYYGIKI